MAIIESKAAVPQPAPKKQKLGKLAQKEERAAYLFLLPWLLGLVLLLGIPVFASIFLSMTEWNLMNPPKWIGFENYRDMFSDKDFYHSMGVTLRYLVISVPIYLVAAMGLALLLNQKLKGMYFFRTVMFMPSVIAGTAVAVMWSMMLNPELGVVNQMLRCNWHCQPTPLAGQQRLGSSGGYPDGAVGYRRRHHHLPGRAAKYPPAPV